MQPKHMEETEAVNSPGDVTIREHEEERLVYGIRDNPPVHLTILFVLQQIALTIASVLAVPIIITQIMARNGPQTDEYAKELLDVRGQLVGVTVFCVGLSSFLQVTFGVRLPLIQGSSYTFLPVISAVIFLPKWSVLAKAQASQLAGIASSTPSPPSPIWQAQLCELAGALMLASLVQIVLGATGLVGLLAQFIGPLSIAPILALIALGIMDAITANCQHHWGIAGMTVGLTLIFAELLPFRIPIPTCSKEKKLHFVKIPLFQILPVFLAVVIMWGFSGILTVTNVFPNNRTHPNYMARTDSKLDSINNALWFSFPYPGRWGLPTIGIAAFVGMLVATISSVVESIGDYHACAAICGVPRPPVHAINRGMLFEGLGSLIGGMLYTSHGTTSYSGNISSITLTRVGSRLVFQAAGLTMVVLGVIGKIGAALASIPEPILGGLLLVNMSLLFAMSFSYLQKVNMNKSRNMTVIGVSILAGVIVPRWVRANSNVFQTPSSELNQALFMLLGTEIVFGGFLAFFLDLILPGSRIDRGMEERGGKQKEVSKPGDQNDKIYGFWKWCPTPSCCTYIPFMPGFDANLCGCTCCCCKDSGRDDKDFTTHNNLDRSVSVDTMRTSATNVSSIDNTYM